MTLEVWFCLCAIRWQRQDFLSFGQDRTGRARSPLATSTSTAIFIFIYLLLLRRRRCSCSCCCCCCSIFNQRLWWRLGSASWTPCNFLFGCGRSLWDRRRAKKRKTRVDWLPIFSLFGQIPRNSMSTTHSRESGIAGVFLSGWRRSEVVIRKCQQEHQALESIPVILHCPSLIRLGGDCSWPICSFLAGVVMEIASESN